MRFLLALLALAAHSQPRAPLVPNLNNAADHAWSAKPVLASRLLDDLTHAAPWKLQGAGTLTFGAGPARPHLRVDVALQGLSALPAANAVRTIAGEDWRDYNRLSFWLRADTRGFPVLTLIVTLRNQGGDPISEVHLRESGHNITLHEGAWTHVVWEIPHLQRNHVTALVFQPWVNKRLPADTDRAAYEVGPIELQRVTPDPYEGWDVAPGRIAFSHTGYLPDAPKTAIATNLDAAEFQVLRDGAPVLRKKLTPATTRLGAFQLLDFSELRTPGTYILAAGNTRTQPFRIAPDLWDVAIAKVINFFYVERCGTRIPGVHDECHRDWQAEHDGQKIVINGGWHDAGDLSQGAVHTGEATHAMFTLALAARASGRNPAWLPQLVDEAKWGLAWLHKVRFPGGYRVGFASMNTWTNGIPGDADDRTVTALNNPNVNYIAAAAEAAAAHYLMAADPDLARKSLAIAEEDWHYAIDGVESPATVHTPAYTATELELASTGIVASVELYRVTHKDEYAHKAWELATVVAAAQQKTYVGTTFPLSGFFYTDTTRTTLFHQFHRAADQAPTLAMTMLCDTFPDHPDWISWYAVAARYAEYQKRSATATAPYSVLPAYVYRDDEWQQIAENDRYGSSRESFRQQVLAGMPMGGGYYLRAFPVWFTRRGNYGVLLSQTQALAAAARLRSDRAAADLVQSQLQWIVGRNPFSQSTMWGEGYDFIPQYSVSVGDIVGSLPVGMMTRDNADRPYYPSTNTYVFKEVWVHPAARWLATLAETLAPRPDPSFTATHTVTANGDITIAATGPHQFSIRTENLTILSHPTPTTWRARPQSSDSPWLAVVFADNNLALRREIH